MAMDRCAGSENLGRIRLEDKYKIHTRQNLFVREFLLDRRWEVYELYSSTRRVVDDEDVKRS